MKKAVVIGATSGMGRELVLDLVACGYRVAALGRREEELQSLKEQCSERVITRRFDATKVDETESVIGSVIEELGGLDLLVFSSGMGELNNVLDFLVEKKTIELNVLGFTSVMDYTYNYFSNRSKGHIVGISSVMGLRGSCAAPAYSATKSFQINYLESLRQRAFAQNKDIIITDIRPGSVDTAMMKGEGHFWISSPEKAAKQICKAIEKRKSVQYVSKRWSIIGVLLKILPRSLFVRMGKMP